MSDWVWKQVPNPIHQDTSPFDRKRSPRLSSSTDHFHVKETRQGRRGMCPSCYRHVLACFLFIFQSVSVSLL